MAIHRLTLEERQKFARKTAHIAEAFEEIIGSDILSKTQELLLNKYGPAAATKLQIVIGINTLTI